MSRAHFGLQHVPFEAASAFPGAYPGMENYIDEMQKYQPSSTYDEVALASWISAALFVSGLKIVGRDLTQAKLVKAINRETAFTGDGLISPRTGHFTRHVESALCGAAVHVVNGQFATRVIPGTHEVFLCFDTKSTTPVAPLVGTPGS
jgi:hypothetical protein